MTEYNIFTKLKEAFETSTHNCNCFADALASIKWDSTYTADGEQYFNLGGFTFTTPSLDPFNMPWECTAFFSDNSMLSFR